MDTINNRICTKCKTHTIQAFEWIGNGRYKLMCMECKTMSPVFDENGNEISHEQIMKEREIWE